MKKSENGQSTRRGSYGRKRGQINLIGYPLLESARTSSGKRYSCPAFPKLTRISFRPRFSTVLTNVPSRGRRLPVFCDRIGLTVLNGSPGLMVTSVVRVTVLESVYSTLSGQFHQHSTPVPKAPTQFLDVESGEILIAIHPFALFFAANPVPG